MNLEQLLKNLKEELLKSKLKLSSIETTTTFDDFGDEIKRLHIDIEADQIDKGF